MEPPEDNYTPNNNDTPVESGLGVSDDESVDLAQTTDTKKPPLTEPISWQATDESHQSRGPIWYVIFAIVILGLIALAIFVFKSVTFAILLPIMALAVIVLSSKSTPVVNYSISPKGVYISDKLYDYSELRAFGITLGKSQSSITILPVKRLALSLVIYFPNDLGERIVDMLGARLPLQEIKPDAVEKFIRLIRL